MNKYKFKLLTSTGLGCEYFYCYGDEHFEQWLKRKNIKYEIDKKSINRFNKQKEVLDKIKEKGVMYYDPEYSKIYGELCSMPGANNTRTPVIVIDDDIFKLLEEIE